MLSIDDAGFPSLDGQPLRLPPKERAVLALLARRQPDAVSKLDFAGAAWAGRLMSDESLARCISQLRRVLAPAGLRIESVYGTGYRLEIDAQVPPTTAPTHGLSGAALETYQHARQLALQRTPVAVQRATEMLRELIVQEPAFVPAKVALVDVLTAAIGWGQLDTDTTVDEGLRLLDAARLQQPQTPGLDAAHGAMLDAAWRFDEAGLVFEQALQNDGSNPDTLLAHSRHLLLTDRPLDAVTQLRAALRLSPHTPLLHMILARALAQSGQRDLAVAEADAAVQEHPGQLVLTAFALAMRALVDPSQPIEAPARRLSYAPDTPPFVWTVLSYVLSRVGQREDALDIIDAVLLCSRTTTGEASLYAAPLAALGEWDRAAQLLVRAYDERCGMLAMVLRDPAHADWLPQHPVGRQLLRGVFGAA